MAMPKSDYFWNKLRRARRRQENRSGKTSAPGIADVSLSAASGQPLDISGFDSPQSAIANARKVEMTGAGPDGVIQPGNPVAMLDTTGGPAMIHEGELMVQPDGAPPNTRQVLSNEQLQEVETRYNVPGFFGGTKKYPKWQQQQVLKRMEKDYDVPGYQLGSRSTRTPTFEMPTIELPSAPSAPGIPGPGSGPSTPSSVGGIALPDLGALAPSPPQQVEPAPSSGIPDTGAPQQVAEGPGLAIAPAPTLAPVEPVVQQQVDVALPTPEAVAAEPPPAPEEAPVPEWAKKFTDGIPDAAETGTYGAGAAEGFDFLRSLARGESPVLDAIENRTLEDLAARQAYDDIAFEQSTAGLSDSQRATLRAQHERGQRVTMGSTLSDIAAERGKSAIEAARTITTTGLQQARWEADHSQRVRQYEDSQGWMEYNEFLRAGNFDEAAARYESITGEPIDIGALRDEYYDEKGNEAAVSLAGVVDRVWHTLPVDEDGNPNWQDSSTMMASVDSYWRWNNDGEEFDPSNPDHVAEMDSVILKSMSMSDAAEKIAKIKTDPFYADLVAKAATGDPDAVSQLAIWDAALNGLTQLSYLDGYQLGVEDGKVVFKDAEGNVVYSVDPETGVTLDDYASPSGLRALIGNDEYSAIEARVLAGEVARDDLVGELRGRGWTEAQANDAASSFFYDGYQEYKDSAELAEETPLSKSEWIAANRPSSYSMTGVPEGTVEGDVWYDGTTFYKFGEDGREVLAADEGDPWSTNNMDIMDTWQSHVVDPDAQQAATAAGEQWPPEMPAEVTRIANEAAQEVLDGLHALPPEYSDANHPVFQAIVNHSSTVDELGSRGRFDPSGTSDDQFYFSTFGEPMNGEIETGGYMNYNGRLMELVETKAVEQEGDNATVYVFVDVQSGERFAARADRTDKGFHTAGLLLPEENVPLSAWNDLERTNRGDAINAMLNVYRYYWENNPGWWETVPLVLWG